MVIDGAFTGVIGELIRVDISYFREKTSTIRVDYKNEIEVYSYQLIPIQHVIELAEKYGINVHNSGGSFINGYEIIKQLKERNNMPTKSLNLGDLENFSFYCTSSKADYGLRVNTEITDVNIIVPNKVVEVTFSDGTKEKSVCREPDVFSLEQAISICISKKIMGGSGAYNNAVKRGMKVYDDKLKKEEVDKAEQERIAKKRAKRLAYKERRAAKKAKHEEKKKQLEREEKIQIQTAAYIRAMEYMQNQSM